MFYSRIQPGWYALDEKERKEQSRYIFSCFEHGIYLGQAHFSHVCITFPRSQYCDIFHLRPSLPTHRRPSWRLAKHGGRWVILSPSRRMTISYPPPHTHLRQVSLVYYLIFSPYWYCMYVSKLSGSVAGVKAKASARLRDMRLRCVLFICGSLDREVWSRCLARFACG
jgi:hypothetical protein